MVSNHMVPAKRRVIYWCNDRLALLLVVLFARQRQKNREAESNKTKLQLELKAIMRSSTRTFVFNALSSIQGLINKQDITGANRYLSDFARLMRESLTNSNKSEIPLSEEIRILKPTWCRNNCASVSYTRLP